MQIQMINIHLANDEKFINSSLDLFEEKFPKSNIMLINNNSGENKYIKKKLNVINVNFNDVEASTDKIIEFSEGHISINIFIHFLDYGKALLVEELRKKIDFKYYWIFYGADLYNRLYLKGSYELYDKNNNQNKFIQLIRNKLRKTYFYITSGKEEVVIKKFIKNLNYFCFWNVYDYSLLRANYVTNAIYKEFIYDSFGISNLKIPLEVNEPNSGLKSNLLINHSGSPSGNHLTILRRLNNLAMKNSIHELFVPLNYGQPYIIEEVDVFCRTKFSQHYMPITSFLKKEVYFKILNKVDVAIFGHRRQEAGGNLTYLLASGVKVFLRQDNNLLKFYKDKGIIIFCFEKDLNDEKDLAKLPIDSKIRNYELMLKLFSEKNVKKMYQDLIDF